ncbi:MAG: polysaccharide deacetylase family protein [Victivallales bacterium]
MNKITYLFPGGLPKALTMSYDDGVINDRRLVEIFNRNGIKGTFHLNASYLGNSGKITPEELLSLYAGHEVSCHSFTHPFLERCPKPAVLNEVLEDRKRLEELVGYPVRGMSYPMGTYSTEVKNILNAAGIVYSRTTQSTHRFVLPDNWLEWAPTCHHRENILEKAEAFKNNSYSFSLFYVWGHAYEFDRDSPENNWGIIEEFCAQMANLPDVWYATNIAIHDYVTALKRLEFSVNCDIVHNPSAVSLWISVSGRAVEITPGELKRL